MTTVFISYRRRDSAASAGRLYDRLRSEFGKDNLFMDIDTIGAGTNFTEAIERGVKQSDVVLAVIGDKWLSGGASETTNRLHEQDDYVRWELSAALSNRKLIIPVLIDGAEMPDEALLPEELKPLRQFQALKLNNDQFDANYDTLRGKLMAAMDQAEVSGAQMRTCRACASRVPQAAIKCPSCGKYREDAERNRALSVGCTGLGLGLVLLNALYKDLPADILLPSGVAAVVLCAIGLLVSIYNKMTTGHWL
jgi:hypothetical protein